jgi:branched-chain amino acid transport system substrate-binding protein
MDSNPSTARSGLFGRRTFCLSTLSSALYGAAAQAQADRAIKVGVLTDMSGPYAAFAGPGSVVAARLAVEDFLAASKVYKVEVLAADHQNKPDVGSSAARKWIDVDHVDVIVDVPVSSVALAVSKVVRDLNKVFLPGASATSDLTGSQCSPNTVHWTYDTWSLANSTGKAIVKTGGDTWFFLTADYAFGHALERDTAAVVVANGGKVLGEIRHPFPTTDFSSYLLKAQASQAKVIGLANAGDDTINAIKQAAEFGIVESGQSLAGLLVFITDVHSLGLKASQGLLLTEAFYWDLNDGTRAFSKRFAAQMSGNMPSMVQAGVYCSVLHYLKAAKSLGSAADGRAVVAKMKELPTDDPLFGQGTIRADGRKLHPMYLFEVKKPAESKYPWDYYKLRATTPADQAFRPLNEGGCPLVSG